DALADFDGDAPDGQSRDPFHWPLEFPEVFFEERKGFDAFIGNPPFIYGKNISRSFELRYNSMLTEQTPESTKNSDISAHFLSRAFALTATHSCLGLICTSSIAEGETREAGLAQIPRRGGTIYSAASRTRWPGRANVLVSIVH